jgi:hypothetical protein
MRVISSEMQTTERIVAQGVPNNPNEGKQLGMYRKQKGDIPVYPPAVPVYPPSDCT